MNNDQCEFCRYPKRRSWLGEAIKNTLFACLLIAGIIIVCWIAFEIAPDPDGRKQVLPADSSKENLIDSVPEDMIDTALQNHSQLPDTPFSDNTPGQSGVGVVTDNTTQFKDTQ